MSTSQADPLLDRLVSDFGGNYVFALDVLEQYRQDRTRLEASWRTYFDRAFGVAPEPDTPPVTVIVGEARGGASTPPLDDDRPIRGRPDAPAGADSGIERLTLARREVPTTPAAGRSKAVARISILPGDILQPIRGGAIRIVENMEASLPFPTATSDPDDPGAHRRGEPPSAQQAPRGERGRARSASPTSWPGRSCGPSRPSRGSTTPTPRWTGRPHRVQRDAGAPRDRGGRAAARTAAVRSSCPTSRTPRRWTSPSSCGLRRPRRPARARARSPPTTSWARRSRSPTPARSGPRPRRPRLMPGQGVIVATGRLDYPRGVQVDGARARSGSSASAR